jgi:hypothetical protein
MATLVLACSAEAQISFVNQSSGTGTTPLAIAYPASIVSGNLLVLAISNKYPTNGPSTPSGWTLLGNAQQSGGSGPSGVDTGSVYCTVFYRVADGLESGTLSVTITSGNSAVGVISQFSSNSPWIITSRSGSDNTPGSAWSVTTATNPNLDAGDVIFAASAFNTDGCAFGSESFTCSGCTFSGSVNERFDSGTSSGQDCGLLLCDQEVATGPSSGNITFAATAASSGPNSPCGATVFLRLRHRPLAIITEPLLSSVADSYYFAGYSYIRLHGFDSQLDNGHEIVDYSWSDGEGRSLYGPIASFRYDTSGSKNVSLTVTDSVGETSTASITTTWVTWSGTTIYVNDSTGSDTAPNDGSIGLPFKTAHKAFSSASPSVGAPVRILFNRGDIMTVNSGDKFPAPSLLDAYGSGANPQIRIPDGAGFWGQIGTAYENQWGFSVISKNVDYNWSSSATTKSNRVGPTAPGSAIINSRVQYGLVEGSDATSDPIKITWDNVEVSGKDLTTGGGGLGISNSGGVGSGFVSFLGVLNCYIHGNSPYGATNVYLHGQVSEIRNNLFDGESNHVHSAYFSSGMQKYCIIGNVAENAEEGFGCGSNPQEGVEAQDCWFEGNTVFNCSIDGVDLQYTNRAIVINNVFDSSTVGIELNSGYASGYPLLRTQDVRVWNNTFYAIDNQCVWTDGVRSISLKNNLIVRTSDVDSADKKFVQLGLGAHSTNDDYNYVEADGNVYASLSGDDDSVSGTFFVNGSNLKFAGVGQWTSIGFDGNGTFLNLMSDTVFNDAGAHDFTLASGSPAIDFGLSLPIVHRDFSGIVRSTIDSSMDAGAFEFQ